MFGSLKENSTFSGQCSTRRSQEWYRSYLAAISSHARITYLLTDSYLSNFQEEYCYKPVDQTYSVHILLNISSDFLSQNQNGKYGQLDTEKFSFIDKKNVAVFDRLKIIRSSDGIFKLDVRSKKIRPF